MPTLEKVAPPLHKLEAATLPQNTQAYPKHADFHKSQS